MTAYSDLVADIPEWTARSDLTTANIEKFIARAEDKMSRMIRVAEQRKSATQAAYSDPATTSVIFKTPAEVLQPITLRAKNGAGDTLRTYESLPDAAFRELQRSDSTRPVWTPDPLSAIPATHYNGNTYGGANAASGLSDAKGVAFCIAIKPTQVAGNTIIFRFRDTTNNANIFQVLTNTSNELIINTRSSGGSQVGHTFTDLTVTVDAWNRIIITIDAENSAIQAYLNDTASADSPTFSNTDAIAFSDSDIMTIGANHLGNNNFRGEMTQLGMATYAVDGSNAMTTFFDASLAKTRARIFTAGATGTPVQYGTSRGTEIFGKVAEVWSPDGRPDRNHGSAEGFELLDGQVSVFDTEDDFGVSSDLFGVHVSPAYGDGTEEFELEYYGEFPRITSANTDNWLSTNHYDIYFFGALAEAYEYLQNDTQEERYREKFAGAVGSLNRSNQRKLRGTGPYVRRNTRRVTP